MFRPKAGKQEVMPEREDRTARSVSRSGIEDEARSVTARVGKGIAGSFVRGERLETGDAGRSRRSEDEMARNQWERCALMEGKRWQDRVVDDLERDPSRWDAWWR